ncbi:hypothetical protein AMTR_s00030p00024330 [Amborella trichopoda]|uniref:Uncharacterized protein n=2 Tax=Amborella trichopoda TaxID=13333 RepID=U5CRY7_AMBTC|nr:hypothetical protein AMTR_s00030p00024330 [Amborella trichopoda]
MGAIRTSLNQKAFSSGTEDFLSGPAMKISSISSPRASVSRSSSRSLQDDIDDSDFSCPFAVDDDDITDSHNRCLSFDRKTNLGKAVESRQMMSAKKSQDAAVGALVHMLRSAPPLRQDSLNSSKLSQVSNVETQGQKSQLHDPIHFREENPKTESSLLGISSSGFLAPMTAAVAFEELKNYKEMKDFLLKRNKAGD